jgi:kynurenine formamidase
MKVRSFIIAYALVLAILLFADRRPRTGQQDRYSHVVDLTNESNVKEPGPAHVEVSTQIIAPGALIPGTWNAGQIPPERLVAPLVVMDLNMSRGSQISLDDIAEWEAHHGVVPQGALVAIRQNASATDTTKTPESVSPLPIARDAAQFLIDARYTIGFAVETPVDMTSDRTMARQLALRGNYVVEGAARFTSLPVTGSLIIVAPAKNKKVGAAPVRILAMVR